MTKEKALRPFGRSAETVEKVARHFFEKGSFYSAVCGRRNSLQEGFFDKLREAAFSRLPV